MCGGVEEPAIGVNRGGESQPENSGQCGRKWHPSPFSETHMQSLTYLARCLLEYPESSERAADAPGLSCADDIISPGQAGP